MKVIIYKRREDQSISRIEFLQKYTDFGHTEQGMMEAIEKFNANQGKLTAAIHEVAECDEEIVSWVASDSSMLFPKNIVHSGLEELPVNTLIYVLRKAKGYDMPAMSVIRLHAKGVRIPECQDEAGMLPFAWVRAKDLIDLLGISKRDMKQLISDAKSLAWGWYKED